MSALAPTVRGFPSVQLRAPLVARGFVVLVNVRPDLAHGYWVCDQCGEKVRPSRFGTHAEWHR